MKKIVAILLVVALMSAMFVLPAHAHEVEETEITPRAVWCQVCSQPVVKKTSTYTTSWYSVRNCEAWPSSHMHRDHVYVTWYICTNSVCTKYNQVQQRTTQITSTDCSNS